MGTDNFWIPEAGSISRLALPAIDPPSQSAAERRDSKLAKGRDSGIHTEFERAHRRIFCLPKAPVSRQLADLPREEESKGRPGLDTGRSGGGEERGFSRARKGGLKR